MFMSKITVGHKNLSHVENTLNFNHKTDKPVCIHLMRPTCLHIFLYQAPAISWQPNFFSSQSRSNMRLHDKYINTACKGVKFTNKKTKYHLMQS